jgi:hypothetical protein
MVTGDPFTNVWFGPRRENIVSGTSKSAIISIGKKNHRLVTQETSSYKTFFWFIFWSTGTSNTQL